MQFSERLMFAGYQSMRGCLGECCGGARRSCTYAKMERHRPATSPRTT
ncbi:hypothetical protein FOC30_06590 [Burkholderia multivorans]|nr:hypothetical protein FOC30_06590 [Burkholderia multivorans]